MCVRRPVVSPPIVQIADSLRPGFGGDVDDDASDIGDVSEFTLNDRRFTLAHKKVLESQFKNKLNDTDLIYDYYISKFDKDSIFYKIIFNGTPNVFLKSMNDNNFDFDTQKKTWVLK